MLESVVSVSLGDLSSLQCQKHLSRDAEARTDVLILAFAGEYRPGSDGNPDASYISAMALGALAGFDPDALILDFSDLTYGMGGAMLSVFQDISEFKDDPGIASFPVVVVTSDKCRGAILSLTGVAEEEASWHHRSLRPALTAAHQAARDWLDA